MGLELCKWTEAVSVHDAWLGVELNGDGRGRGWLGMAGGYGAV